MTSTWPKARRPLRSRSAKQAKKDREFTAMREVVFERDGYRCQLPLDGHQCSGRLEAHHVKRRSQGGTNDPSNLKSLCSGAHAWVHANPAEAALFGLLEMRGGG